MSLDLFGAVIMTASIYCRVPVTGLNILSTLSLNILTKTLGGDHYSGRIRVREVNQLSQGHKTKGESWGLNSEAGVLLMITCPNSSHYL